MTAEAIAKALGGRKAGGGWTARCPAHDDRTPSLSITDTISGKVLVCCHAGCGQERVIAELRRRCLWSGASLHRSKRQPCPKIEHKRDGDDSLRSASALALWRSSTAAASTLIEPYLASRGLHLPSSDVLRFNAALRHPTGSYWPAMVALVVHGETSEALAVHRTFLARDGHGKAPVDPPKMMLGPCRGGVVRLDEPGDVLMVGEGIETCLAAMQATGKPAWAALSTSGLRSLDLPRAIANVIVLADGDAPGEAAAQHCARRWQREGRSVRIARPPSGMDFNDLLKVRNPALTEGAQ